MREKKKPGPKGTPKDRFQLVAPPEVLEEVKGLADGESRSISNMLVVLVKEALAARREKKETDLGNWVPTQPVASALTP